MTDLIRKTALDIRDLKIQGATDIAKAALEALLQSAKKEKLENLTVLREKIDQLAFARPTEPLTQNTLAYVFWQVDKGQPLTHAVNLMLAKIEDAEKEIVENGVPLIKREMTVLTHCHSSTVEEILKRAWANGTRFKVFLTETRPRFQGRITAEHLLKEGLKLEMITDSGAASAVGSGKVDLVILGSDAVSFEGDAVNKVGSYGIALAAREKGVPLYLATTLLKVCPNKITLEERESSEVWEKPPKGLEISNPAFDMVPKEFIAGFITEFGIIKPAQLKRFTKQNYPWIYEFRIQSSASPYRSYLHLGEKVDPQKHILATFRLAAQGNFGEVAGGVAAESSVGTWTQVITQLKEVWEKLHARVLKADKKTGFLEIAYPLELFEPGNIPQLLSSVAGNIFGLKEVKKLKLLDLELPQVYVKSFPGPKLGVKGIRKLSGVFGRPLIGCIIKPKEGLDVRQHARVAMEVYEGGVDFVKDDENLTSQNFNPFKDRVAEIMKCLNDSNPARSSGGHLNKIYAFNITASAEVMKERAEWVKKHRGNCLMVDILTVGFSAFQYIRNQDHNLILHGHRAGHAALTRDPEEGISMLVLAKLARLAGVDSLHTGTVVGKMEGGEEEVVTINKFLLSEWYGLKPVLPVASGGLYPSLIPDLVKILGKEVLLNFGGGIHGHPRGSKAGAQAVYQALEATEKEIPLTIYAKAHPELKEALETWSKDG